LNLGANVVGIDPVIEALQFAREAPGNVGSAKSPFFICGAAEDLPFSNETFGSVLCTDVIEHVVDPDRLLAEAKRILKPNGTLVLTTPNKIGPDLTDPEHKKEFTSSELLDILHRHFAIVQLFESHSESMRKFYVSRPRILGGKSIPKYIINFLTVRFGYNPFRQRRQEEQSSPFAQLTAIATKSD
jgi:2-polyprenyl-3-methyl-5-hydroxy-6-metoxy-1,4-benzoquinol methylase